jgi:hypothetical protein
MTRLALPMIADPPRVACTSCGKCCTYVSVGINEPKTLRFACDVLWYLYHDGLAVYRDGEGEWSVVIETRCRHLGADLLCAVYEKRPVICREFDDTSCEVNAPGGGLTFDRPEAFLHYLRGWRPALYRRVLKDHVPEPLARALQQGGR